MGSTCQSAKRETMKIVTTSATSFIYPGLVLMKNTKTRVILVMAGIALVAGCASVETQSKPQTVPEIRPGILQGYLPVEMLPDSLELIPPPPIDGSTAFALVFTS
jgi:hypothetical protein